MGSVNYLKADSLTLLSIREPPHHSNEILNYKRDYIYLKYLDDASVLRVLVHRFHLKLLAPLSIVFSERNQQRKLTHYHIINQRTDGS